MVQLWLTPDRSLPNGLRYLLAGGNLAGKTKIGGQPEVFSVSLKIPVHLDRYFA
jgi:hypothetical protein